MQFLCLPGAFGSAKNFRVQLGPLAQEIERRGLASFVYTQGRHEVEPPKGWENYFGARPCYRFIDTRHGDVFDHLRRIIQMPRGLDAEDAMRMFQNLSTDESWQKEVLTEAVDDVFNTIDENPDVDAILGYSEGALIGASLVVEEAMRAERTGRPRRIKFAVFISGSPPFKQLDDGSVICLLADEVGTAIDIPTLHIWGCDDAFLTSAVALFNVCDPSKSELFDHGLGHIVPRDAENIRLISDILEDMIRKVEEENGRGVETSSNAGSLTDGDGPAGLFPQLED
ncbi:uncharacterized protein THITE_125661 [Thermothielavioides terrestris NRRL 8126]|uniref:Serine hydrolase domain-containing protein n=1 Tax=Thermothielavioides terrestris (strain ATCC 38088 / NRRL 8126) TaxID=578455 RepID=G2R8L3_THETT|nr:uncharacterized protein THITE_125661 [Thermothielavioides terrestris NRRL 8126]AEO67428.1 hypothetical protein THITE_125661 [Thermothielavioides terrestris NRRL 8126]